MALSAESLILFVRSKRECHFKTTAHQKAFTAQATDGGIEITPKSTGTSRQISRKRIERFCAEFAEAGSKEPGTYRDVTFDASYLLATAEAAQRDGIST